MIAGLISFLAGATVGFASAVLILYRIGLEDKRHRELEEEFKSR